MTFVEERGGSTRRDVNRKHFEAFRQEQIKAYQEYFRGIGSNRIHLQILATLREFRGRGHASSICKWAKDLVCRESLKEISVMASPMGFELYTWLRFAERGSFFVQVPGEEEKLELRAMRYRPPT